MPMDTIFLNSTKLSQMGWQNASNAEANGKDAKDKAKAILEGVDGITVYRTIPTARH